MSQHLQNIAIVGGNGNIGNAALTTLLETKRFNITAISRADSSSAFPPEVSVKKGDYADRSFLESALKGQDAFMISLGVRSPPETQDNLIEAAAAAGVKWILPNEYGSDNDHPVMGPGQGFLATHKNKYLTKIKELGSNYIAYVNGCWYDYSLTVGAWGIDVKNRSIEFYGDGTTACSTTTLRTAGLGIARLLSLPVTTTDGSPSLSDYKNKRVFVEGMQASQRDMLNAVQRVTGTSDQDWKIEQTPVDDVIEKGREMMKGGGFQGFVQVLYGLQFKPGSGSNFHAKCDNKVLGLQSPADDLDEATKKAVKDTEAGKSYY